MRRIDLLIESARERSKNSDYSVDSTTGVVTSGISDDQFIEWANDAQDHLQAMILDAYPEEFIETSTITLTSGTAEYTIPDRVFINNKIISVQYSHSGNVADYERLDQLKPRDRRSVSGYPYGYIRRGNSIILVDIPNRSGALLRVEYYRELDDLDIRRAKVSGTPSGATITLLGPTGSAASTVEELKISDAEQICIVDGLGNVLLYNGVVSTSTPYNTATNVLTLAANVSTYLVSGYTLANLADKFVVLRSYSSTHSALPDNCERYIRTYMQKRALTVDESNTSVEEDVELKSIELDIIKSFAENSRDIEWFPILDEDLMW